MATKMWSMKLPEEELRKWKAEAKRYGIPLARMIRSRMSDECPKTRKIVVVDRKFLVEIARIGNNLNQIARKLNTEGVIDLLALEVLAKMEAELSELVSLAKKGKLQRYPATAGVEG